MFVDFGTRWEREFKDTEYLSLWNLGRGINYDFHITLFDQLEIHLFQALSEKVDGWNDEIRGWMEAQWNKKEPDDDSYGDLTIDEDPVGWRLYGAITSLSEVRAYVRPPREQVGVTATYVPVEQSQEFWA